MRFEKWHALGNAYLLVEQGNDEELLARKGFYYELYMSQFKKQEEEILDLQQAVPAD